MSYSVIYKRFRVILDNSKLRKIHRRKVLIRIWTYLLKTKQCKVCVAKGIGALQRNCFLGKGVKSKKIKD
jgi:hypothetical protein